MVATDLQTGEEVVLQSGPVAQAVQASLSIPGVFVPVELDGRLLVDGALVNRVPASLCRQIGAELVIAVDVGFAPSESYSQSARCDHPDHRHSEQTGVAGIEADVLITPDLGNVTLTQLNRSREIIEMGRLAALQSLDLIRDKLEALNWGCSTS